MTMVSTGPISIGGNATTGGLNQSINIELGRSATATSSLNESALRTLAGVPSGAISLSNFYGKANQFAFTISSNQTNANLRTLAVNAGWNQSTKVVATIGSGVAISSNSTGTPALTVSGSFPGGVELINSGTIVGMGGAGGLGASSYFSPFNGQPGSAGGLALSVSTSVSINNGSGTIAGGGGGGGGGGNFDSKAFQTAGGGGGGGGRSSNAANSAGGPGGSGGPYPSGSAGGSGTYSSAGSGGAGGSYSGATSGTGGSGGGWGSSGATGGNAIGTSTFYPPGAGGSGGGAVSGNSNITWIATGTRNGAIT